jgi:hypothetical protein
VTLSLMTLSMPIFGDIMMCLYAEFHNYFSYAAYHFAECRYVECHYAYSRGATSFNRIVLEFTFYYKLLTSTLG